MKNINLHASEINKLMEGCKATLLNNEEAKEIINSIDCNMVHFAKSDFHNRNFYMLNNQLYIAVSPKDLGSYKFYKIQKEVI